MVHGGIIDAHTHYATVGIPQQAPATALAAHHHCAPVLACDDSGYYYGRSNYAARKEAEYAALAALARAAVSPSFVMTILSGTEPNTAASTASAYTTRFMLPALSMKILTSTFTLEALV